MHAQYKSYRSICSNLKKILAHSCKLGIKNEKIRKIDQHMNTICQMQSLERMLTLVPLVPFNVFVLMCLWLVSCESIEKKTLRVLVNEGLGSCKYVM